MVTQKLNFRIVVQHVLVAQSEHVLQEGQAGHHPHGNGRSPVVAAVGGPQRLLEPLPVYGVSEQDELVPLRYEVAQHDLEEAGLDGL